MKINKCETCESASKEECTICDDQKFNNIIKGQLDIISKLKDENEILRSQLKVIKTMCEVN